MEFMCLLNLIKGNDDNKISYSQRNICSDCGNSKEIIHKKL